MKTFIIDTTQINKISLLEQKQNDLFKKIKLAIRDKSTDLKEKLLEIEKLGKESENINNQIKNLEKIMQN